MCRWLVLLCATVSAIGWTLPAHGKVQVQVLGTFPSGNVITLPRSQTVYLHLHYRTDHPIGIWVVPYYEGKKVAVGSSPSRTYDGSGEALVWFFLTKPNLQVDQIRITAGDGSFSGTPVVAIYPVHIFGSDVPASRPQLPAWVKRLNARDAAAAKAAYAKQENTPLSAGEVVFSQGLILIMFATGIFGIVAPIWALRRWRGGWRVAAIVPAALMAFVILRLVVDLTYDPTSHNLWPLELLPSGALSILITLILMAARKVTGASRTP